MAQPDKQTDKQADKQANSASPLSGAGIFWINSGVNDEATLPYKDFVRWYEDVHIPDVLNANPGRPLPAAWRYECPFTLWPTPFLVVYKLPDLDFVGSQEFRSIPIHHPTLPEGGPVGRFASFYARFSRHAETWTSSPDAKGRGILLVSEAIEPADSGTLDAFHSWYRGAYMREVSQFSGWLRSTRFEVVVQNEIRGDVPPGAPPPARKPMWLTLHEFDGTGNFERSHFPGLTTSLLGEAEATRRAEREATKVEVLPFHLVRSYGDEAAAFVDAEETRS